jgi:microcystin-dependent protein
MIGNGVAWMVGNNSDYVGGSNVNPTLTLTRGFTYIFDLTNAVGHPLRISSTSVGGGTAFNTGVTNQDANGGTLTFKVPMDAPDTLYYICQAHNVMKGMIRITDPAKELPSGVHTGNVLSWDASGNNWVAKNLTTGITGGSQPFNNIQPYLGLNFEIVLEGVFPSRNGVDEFIGEITIFAGNFEIRGYAFCNGQLLPIAQNTALFSILGTTYGGNGQTTFGLPDLRGRVPIHSGGGSQGPGLSPYDLGEMGGTETNTLLITNMPAHNHTVQFTSP